MSEHYGFMTASTTSTAVVIVERLGGTTVAEAKAVLSQSFDVVLVDYDLPDGKGTDVVHALRAMHFRGNIVAVSSREEGHYSVDVTLGRFTALRCRPSSLR